VGANGPHRRPLSLVDVTLAVAAPPIILDLPVKPFESLIKRFALSISFGCDLPVLRQSIFLSLHRNIGIVFRTILWLWPTLCWVDYTMNIDW